MSTNDETDNAIITKDQQIAAMETTVSKAQAALSRLDDEYMTLDDEETKLVDLLNKTKQQEASLRHALQEACESGAERRLREIKQREEAAVAKLESALFESDSSDEDEDGDDDSKNPAMEATQTASV